MIEACMSIILCIYYIYKNTCVYTTIDGLLAVYTVKSYTVVQAAAARSSTRVLKVNTDENNSKYANHY